MATLIELDLEKIRRNASGHLQRNPTKLHIGDSRRYPIFTWVVWGDVHIREAIASAVMMTCHCQESWPYAQYRIVVPGGVISDHTKSSFQKIPLWCRPSVELRKGIEKPTNPCLFDVTRMQVLAEIPDKHVIYVDSDVYCIGPIDLAELIGSCTVFAAGAARGFVSDINIHALVEELIGKPSALFYKDLGIEKKDYIPSVFWPWLRLNIGLLHRGSEIGPFFADFASHFKDLHRPFEKEKLFGTGEIIFTALMQTDEIPGFKVNLEANWSHVWPFVSHIENCPKIIVDSSGKCVRFEPSGKSPLIHVGHFTHLHLHGKNESDRPIQLHLLDDGQIAVTVRDEKNVKTEIRRFKQL